MSNQQNRGNDGGEVDGRENDSMLDDPIPFDPRASAQAIINEARSIQELLKRYENNTRQLQAEVAEFVLREVDEMDKFKQISTVVAESELTSLQNGAFLRFTRGKSEQDVHPDIVMQTNRMKSLKDSESSISSGIQWSVRFSNSSSTMHSWLPDSAAHFTDCCDAQEALLGWRNPNPDTRNDLQNLLSFLCEGVDPSKSYCCMCNGFLFSPSHLLSDGSGNAFAQSLNRRTSLPAVFREYQKYILEKSCFTEETLLVELWDNFLKHRVTRVSQSYLDSCTPQLIGDASDSIVLVDHKRLCRTHMFRAFFFKGVLGAVEHIGPYFDVINDMSSELSRNHSPYDDAEKRICTLLNSIFASLNNGIVSGGTPNNTVIMVALRVANSDIDGVLLDVKPLSPNLPYRWHFSWGDVCAIGQMRHHENVSFKATRVPVASLVPFDSLSADFFPLLSQPAGVPVVNSTVTPHVADNESESLRPMQKRFENGLPSLGFTVSTVVAASVVLAAGSLLLHKAK